jgi:hypothetical protein
VNERLNPADPGANDDATLARELLRSGDLDEAALEVEEQETPPPLGDLFAGFRHEPL